QPTLAIGSEAVPADRPVGAHDTVARHDETNRVGRVRGTDSTRRARRTDVLREPAVAPRLPDRDLAQRVPNLVLERRAARVHLDLVERTDVAREVRLEQLVHLR